MLFLVGGLLVSFCTGDPIPLSLVDTLPLVSESTHHVQGLAIDGKSFFLSSVDKGEKTGWVFVIDRDTLKINKSIRLALGDQYHPGGMQLVGHSLYVPLAEYRPESTTTILKIDTKTYQVHEVAHVDDHVGAVAVADNGTFYLANWDARNHHPRSRRINTRTTTESDRYRLSRHGMA